MPEVKLDAADVAELAEMLQFLTGWLARDPLRPAPAIGAHARKPGVRTRQPGGGQAK